jgi:hypothetical protein
MSKAKLLIASMLVVFAVGAVAAASASATTQFELEAGHASALFLAKPKVLESLLLKATGEPEISCATVELEKGLVTNDSTLASFKSIDFASCVDKTEPACKVPTIKTVEMKDTLKADGESEGKPDTDEVFAPKNGTGEEAEIAHFKLEGTECKETKELKLAGAFDSKAEDNEKQEDDHHLGFADSPEEKGDPLKYGDQLNPALFMLSYTWTFTVPIFWGLG